MTNASRNISIYLQVGGIIVGLVSILAGDKGVLVGIFFAGSMAALSILGYRSSKCIAGQVMAAIQVLICGLMLFVVIK